ncbi:MAG: hypothetical protein ACYC7E_00495 [Armatimonadota bacterium]
MSLSKGVHLITGVFLLCVLATTPILASMYVPYAWQELVLRADFIGEVECVTAGDIVERFQVVDSWKGEAAQNIINIRMPTDFWNGYLTMAMVGDHYLVAAFKGRIHHDMVSTTIGGTVPLWWRRLPVDYYLSNSGSFTLLPSPQNKDGKITLLNSDWPSVEECKSAVRDFLPKGPGENEKALLKHLIQKRLSVRPKDTSEYKAALAALSDRLSGTKTVAEMIALLLDLARTDPPTWKGILPSILTSGKEQTLKVLEALPADQWPYDARLLADIIVALKPMVTSSAATSTQPTPERLEKLRHVLRTTDPDCEQMFDEAFTSLSIFEPRNVVEYLLKLNVNYSGHTAQAGYLLTSWFALNCTQDRKTYLTMLLKAKQPYIRVAGGVYLCYEDEKAGLAALWQLSSLKGMPGIWAAFTRLRRGDLTAMPRALQAFQYEFENSQDRIFLDYRLAALLSNAAQASGVPAPPVFHRPYAEVNELEAARDRYQRYQAWWELYKDRLKVADPWLPALAEQKID